MLRDGGDDHWHCRHQSRVNMHSMHDVHALGGPTPRSALRWKRVSAKTRLSDYCPLGDFQYFTPRYCIDWWVSRRLGLSRLFWARTSCGAKAKTGAGEVINVKYFPPLFESGPKRGEGFHSIVSHRISDLYRFNLFFFFPFFLFPFSFSIISSYSTSHLFSSIKLSVNVTDTLHLDWLDVQYRLCNLPLPLYPDRRTATSPATEDKIIQSNLLLFFWRVHAVPSNFLNHEWSYMTWCHPLYFDIRSHVSDRVKMSLISLSLSHSLSLSLGIHSPERYGEGSSQCLAKSKSLFLLVPKLELRLSPVEAALMPKVPIRMIACLLWCWIPQTRVSRVQQGSSRVHVSIGHASITVWMHTPLSCITTAWAWAKSTPLPAFSLLLA